MINMEDPNSERHPEISELTLKVLKTENPDNKGIDIMGPLIFACIITPPAAYIINNIEALPWVIYSIRTLLYN